MALSNQSPATAGTDPARLPSLRDGVRSTSDGERPPLCGGAVELRPVVDARHLKFHAGTCPTERSEGLHILSLGAGVQSSALALMAAKGEIGPMPTCAIFADTQAEPKGVYDWLDWLEKQLPFPVYRVTAGNLMEASLRVRVSEAGNKYTKHAVPAFIVDAAGQKGLLMRQCTLDFKITVIIRKIAELRKAAGKPHVTQWIGISGDEARRMKPSRVSYITNIWPLVAHNLTRRECIAWMERNGFPKPPRSSCTFCPYHSDAEWRRLKSEDPEGFNQAIEYDERLRETLKDVIRGTPYLHSSRVPLRDVDFESDHGQPELWTNECEGMCGI